MLEPHPIAKAFPEMTPEEFDALAEDIKNHGQFDPIILYDGKILEGVHRAKICDMLGRPQYARRFLWRVNGPSPAEFAISENIKRRHLTKEQRAKAIHDAYKAEEDARKAKELKVSSQHEKKPKSGPKGGRPKGIRGKTIEIANAHGISRAAVDRAIAAKEPKKEQPHKIKSQNLVPICWSESCGLSRESRLSDAIKLVDKQRNPHHAIHFGVDGYRFTVAKLHECEK